MPLHKEPLVSVVTDPEITQSSVSIVRQAPARTAEAHVGDYRRELVQRFFEQMLNERFGELARRPDAKFLGAGVGGGGLSQDVETVSIGRERAGRQDRGRRSASVAIEAKRVREFGFSAAELDRAKKWMAAFYERAYTERDKTESGSFAQEYLNHFLEGEPSPGIEYEYALVQQLLPGITAAEVSALGKALLARRQPRRSSRRRRRSRTSGADRRRAAGGARGGASRRAVTAWTDTTSTRELMETQARAGRRHRRRGRSTTSA